jgi:phage repressor protein C with HTH and peptisase S24 domain
MTFLPLSIFKVSGKSMLPLYHPEDRVLTWSLFYIPKIGDVVVAKWGEKLIIKRITEIKNNSIILKGDYKESTSSEKLGQFKIADIIGKVIYKF